jgi:DNA-binding XRE family transcriptional regulator|tara:strand:+ start:128 stop:514 length:387 start_codon:yes stop_codon:yes gene_type:complete
MKRNENSYAKVKTNEMLNYRNQLGISQVNMAKKLGLSHRMWNHYEHGTKQVPISVVLSAKYLCKNMDKMDELHNDVKKHEEPLTKWDVDRIEALMKKMKDDISKNSDMVSKILAQSHKEMGFLLSKIN